MVGAGVAAADVLEDTNSVVVDAFDAVSLFSFTTAGVVSGCFVSLVTVVVAVVVVVASV